MTPEIVCGAENPHTGRKCQRWHGHDGLHEYSGSECTSRWEGPPAHSAFTPLVAETAKLEIERLKKLNEGLAERVAQQSELLAKKACKCDCLAKVAATVDELIGKWKADPDLRGLLAGAMYAYDTLREDS